MRENCGDEAGYAMGIVSDGQFKNWEGVRRVPMLYLCAVCSYVQIYKRHRK